MRGGLLEQLLRLESGERVHPMSRGLFLLCWKHCPHSVRPGHVCSCGEEYHLRQLHGGHVPGRHWSSELQTMWGGLLLHLGGHVGTLARVVPCWFLCAARRQYHRPFGLYKLPGRFAVRGRLGPASALPSRDDRPEWWHGALPGVHGGDLRGGLQRDRVQPMYYRLVVCGGCICTAPMSRGQTRRRVPPIHDGA